MQYITPTGLLPESSLTDNLVLFSNKECGLRFLSVSEIKETFSEGVVVDGVHLPYNGRLANGKLIGSIPQGGVFRYKPHKTSGINMDEVSLRIGAINMLFGQVSRKGTYSIFRVTDFQRSRYWRYYKIDLVEHIKSLLNSLGRPVAAFKGAGYTEVLIEADNRAMAFPESIWDISSNQAAIILDEYHRHYFEIDIACDPLIRYCLFLTNQDYCIRGRWGSVLKKNGVAKLNMKNKVDTDVIHRYIKLIPDVERPNKWLPVREIDGKYYVFN